MRTGNPALLGTLLVILIDVGWAIVGPSDWGNGQCVLGNLQLSMAAKIIPDETRAELSIPDSSTVTCANISGSTDQYKIMIRWSSWESDPVTTTAEAPTTKPSTKGTTQFLEDSITAKASTTIDEQTETSPGYRDFPILYEGTSLYENIDSTYKISERNLEELTSTSRGTTTTKMSTTEMSTSLKPEESTGILGGEKEENADVSSISTTDGTTTFIVTTERSTSTSDVITSTTDGSTSTQDLRTLATDASTTITDGSTSTRDLHTLATDASTTTTDGSTSTRDLRTLATDASTTTTDGSTSTQDLNTLATGDTGSTTDASTSTSRVCASSTDVTSSTVHSTDINLFSGDSHQPSTIIYDGTTDVTTSYKVLTEHLLPKYESMKPVIGFEKLTEGTGTRITRSCPPYCDKDDNFPSIQEDNCLTFTLTRKDSLFTVSDVFLEFTPPNKKVFYRVYWKNENLFPGPVDATHVCKSETKLPENGRPQLLLQNIKLAAFLPYDRYEYPENHADCNEKYEKDNINEFCRTAEVIMITIGSFLGVLLVGSLGFYAGKLYCKSRRERDARNTLP